MTLATDVDKPLLGETGLKERAPGLLVVAVDGVCSLTARAGEQHGRRTA